MGISTGTNEHSAPENLGYKKSVGHVTTSVPTATEAGPASGPFCRYPNPTVVEHYRKRSGLSLLVPTAWQPLTYLSGRW